MNEHRRRKDSNGEYGSGMSHLESSWNGRDVCAVEFYRGLEARSGLSEDPCEAGKLHDVSSGLLMWMTQQTSKFRIKVSKTMTMEGEEFSWTIRIFNCSLVLEIFANSLAELKVDECIKSYKSSDLKGEGTRAKHH